MTRRLCRRSSSCRKKPKSAKDRPQHQSPGRLRPRRWRRRRAGRSRRAGRGRRDRRRRNGARRAADDHPAGKAGDPVAAAGDKRHGASCFRACRASTSTGPAAFPALPVINGLNDDRVKILVNGMSITSACANHMNPPLSYVDPSQVVSADVIAGVTPVSKGGDSLGGTIIVERGRSPLRRSWRRRRDLGQHFDLLPLQRRRHRRGRHAPHAATRERQHRIHGRLVEGRRLRAR